MVWGVRERERLRERVVGTNPTENLIKRFEIPGWKRYLIGSRPNGLLFVGLQSCSVMDPKRTRGRE